MQEVYLPPFKACVDAGALTVMSAFNDINGIPASANSNYLKSTLKEKWNFPGFVVSDWDAVEQLIYHGYAKDSLQAVVKAINAGIDMEMKSGICLSIPQGSISNKVINEAVSRILYVKFRKGLFERPYTDEARKESVLLTAENRAYAREVAVESMVLLENKNQLLPITNKNQVISVVGPFSKEQNLMGWWRSNSDKNDVISPFEGLKANAPNNCKIIDKVTTSTDIIIVCVGEKYSMFGENNSRSNIELPNKQSEFIKELKKYNKPIVTIVFNGRPLNLTLEKKNSDALLIAWHPGTEAGNALADIIYGVENPSGKLTTSFPAATGHIPVYYNHRNSGRPKYNYYKGESTEPLYPFGYGLSYSNFNYNNLSLDKTELTETDSVTISVEITNKSKIAGKEVVQLYVQDVVGSTTRPIKELKGFKKVFFEANETKTVKFQLKTEDLKVLDENLITKIEKGEFEVWVGSSSREGLESAFTIK